MLGRRARGVPKNYSPAEIARRTARLRKTRNHRKHAAKLRRSAVAKAMAHK